MKATLGAAAFILATTASLLEPAQVTPVKANDFNGSWKMLWGGSTFRQIFRPDGTSDCVSDGDGYYGVWTSARDNEVTVSETHYNLPCYTQAGEEITFTLTVKVAERKAGKCVRIQLSGDYRGSTVKVVLTPLEAK